jgi:hypothetical protein
MTQRKVALIIGYGQSNERGTGVAPRLAGTAVLSSDTANNVRHTAVFGQANVSLTTTAPYVEPCSIFQKVGEHLAMETGWVVNVVNKAVGGTAATDSWCGWDSTNNRIKTSGESGYDPSGLIAAFVAAITSAVAQGYEVWTITAGHQQDITLGRPVDQVIAASVYIQQLAIAAGATKVFVGKTPRYIGGATEAEWNTGGKIHLIAAGVLAGIPGSYAGADLSTNTDTKLCATDNIQYIHLNHAGVCWAAEKWLIAMKPVFSA